MPGDQTRCKLAAGHDNPLVTEWPASEKANLEARLREGSVVVAYSGCTLRMLPSCRVRGGYHWVRTTTSSDQVEIHDSDELYAKLPLGAASLEGELQRSGRLAVQTTVSGQFQLDDFDPASFPRSADCLGATHVLSALTVGAFRLQSGGTARVGAKAGIGGMGGGGTSQADESTMREAGLPARCEESDQNAPHAECASPIQVFLRPLPANIVDRGPEGTIKVKFLPVRGGQQWDVSVGDRTVCTTPCERWLDPAMPYSFKYDPGFLQKNEYIDVPDLRPYAQQERVVVHATARSMAEFAGGIVTTTFGGGATIAGISLTAVGCAGHDGTMCPAGLITLAAGLLLLAPGIWMIADSAATVQVAPMEAEAPGR